MWHYVVIEIEMTIKEVCYFEHFVDGDENIGGFAQTGGKSTLPCWNILYKAPIDERQTLIISQEAHESVVLHACQVWLEQNKVEGSKYAIMKMFIV